MYQDIFRAWNKDFELSLLIVFQVITLVLCVWFYLYDQNLVGHDRWPSVISGPASFYQKCTNHEFGNNVIDGKPAQLIPTSV